MLPRDEVKNEVARALKDYAVVALVGPRQCGKTTLARSVVNADSPNYFDLESPRSAGRLSEPLVALEALRGTIVIDEIQRRPDLFPVLRVLADEQPLRRRLLVIGSASPFLLRQTSESLAGRIRVIEMHPFSIAEVHAADSDTLQADMRWLRGGFPRAYLARDDEIAFGWLEEFARSVIERDLPDFDARLPWAERRRLFAMLAHYHGQTTDMSAMATSLRLNRETVRRYVDLLTDLFHLRQLQPWFANISKRQVRSPRLYFRDTGMLHLLLGIRSRDALLVHPRLGASWEGLVIEEILNRATYDEAYWWSTHQGAELDLLLIRGTKRYGVEVKHADAPGMTKSIAIATQDLSLDRVTIVAPVRHAYEAADTVRVVPLEEIVADASVVTGEGRVRRTAAREAGASTKNARGASRSRRPTNRDRESGT